MAYIALYRKYRPQTFSEVVGQQHLIATIESAVKNNKVAHAYLFCGPRGTGKTTVARIIAKAVNCTGTDKPCGVCENCIGIQLGNHPDIVEIDAASNNGVDEIRDLVEKVKYAPLAAKYKIYIIDEVHMLTTNAFNALLKTLEDPPEHVLFILATTEAHKVLPTIVSRCQRFDFAKVDQNSLIEKMKEVVAKEQVNCEEDLLAEIATLAEGGMRDALSILDQLIAYCGDSLNKDSLYKVYGLLANSEKVKLLLSVINQDVDEVLALIDRINYQGVDVRRLTNELVEMIKECIVFQLTNNPNLLRKCEEEQVKSIISKADKDKLFELINLFLEASERYRMATNAELYFETCLLRALTMEKADEPAIKEINNQQEVKEEPAVVVKKTVLEEEVVTKEPVLKEENEYLLSLLLRADKNLRAELTESWQKITDYCSDFELGRVANSLKLSEVFAVGEDFVIVCSELSEIVDAINQESNQEVNHKLLQEISEKPRKILAISKDTSRELLSSYSELGKRAVPLQPAAKIVFTPEVKEETLKNPALAIFDDDEIEVVE